MKIKSLTILFFSFICSVNFAQNSLSFDFGAVFRNKESYGDMHYVQMTVDSLGNHYIAGRFHGTLDIDPSPNEQLIQSLDGKEKVFFVKYSPNGQLLWEKTTVLNTDSDIMDIHADQNGNVYLSGQVPDSIDLGFNGSQIIHSGGQYSKFLAKYTSNGVLIWYKSFETQSFHFNLNNDNEVIATGIYQNSIDLGGFGNPYLLNGSSNNIFLAKFAAGGNVLWAKSTPSGNSNDLNVSGIGSDINGNMCISGVFRGVLDADFNSGTYLLNTSYGINSYYIGIYFCKYDTNGSMVWARMSTGLDWVDLQQLRVNQSGEILIMGKFGGTRDFSVTLGQNTITASSTDNVFVVKYDDTCQLTYVNKLTSSAFNVPFWDVTLSENGHCYLLSRKSHTIYTASDTLSHSGTAFDDKSDLSRLEFDAIGNVAQEHFFEISPGPANQDLSYGYAVSLSPDGNLVVLGEAGKFVDMDQTNNTLHPPKTNTYFLASFLNTGAINWCSFIGSNSLMNASNESTTGVVFDEQGGSFVTGVYRQQVDLDLTSNLAYSDSGSLVSSAYVCHYDAANELVWAQSFAGNNVLATINIPPLTDSDNNVLVSVMYSGGLAFTTPTNTFADTLTDLSSRYGLFKFDDSGGLIWAKRIFTETYGGVTLTDVAFNENDEIFVTGTFTDTVFFDVQGVNTMLVSNDGSEDIFVARLNASGDIIWLRAIGGNGVDRSFQILPNGISNFYLSGAFSGTANLNLNGGVSNYTSLHAQATFFASYSNTGIPGYVKTLNSTYYLNISEFQKDHAGNLILAGSFKGTLDCDPSSSVFNLTTNNLHSFVGKYSATGQFNWAKLFDNYSVNEIHSCIVDSSGNILVGGYFSGNIQFSVNPNIHRNAIGGTGNNFLVYFDPNGEVHNVFSFGPLSTQYITHIAYRNGLVGITGSVHEISVDFDPSSEVQLLRSSNYSDGYLLKYQLCIAPQASILWDFFTMTASVSGTGYQWVNAETNEDIPGATQQSFTPTEDGSYYVVVSTADGCSTSSQILEIINLGVEEIQKGQITLYPNPTSSLITIKIENPSESYRVSVCSLSGAPVLTQTLNGNTAYDLDASDWSQGVYLIRLDSENDSQVFKIMKN
ncbi:T9SS type A sorting domain-containing protein [uncultured Fluviicola sp.]|uniref:T9SS type A sorting domain-containing protein n=1 Tax=uncultured Fluviicola sp. TaxID=463303 RepID=UPI0025D574DE|nr:T9SS type A sorting domain-containing protein [uncultured Fluviicola sp.]